MHLQLSVLFANFRRISDDFESFNSFGESFELSEFFDSESVALTIDSSSDQIYDSVSSMSYPKMVMLPQKTIGHFSKLTMVVPIKSL